MNHMEVIPIYGANGYNDELKRPEIAVRKQDG